MTTEIKSKSPRTKKTMQDALTKEANKNNKPEQVKTELTKKYIQPSREGKVNITGYFVPAVKSSFRMIQTKHPEKTIQELLAEAINDLFAKYDVPQTAHLPE
jgi:signal recognition particle GTPase